MLWYCSSALIRQVRNNQAGMPGTVNCSFTGRPKWQDDALPDVLLGNDAVYIFHGIAADLLPLYDDLFTLLSPEEQAKALRYYQAQHQQRYIVQHGILRLLLGKYLGTPPKDFSFTYNATQKPYLASPNANCYFNISHTKNGFLIAISSVEIGIDIEYINPVFAYKDIASNYFSTAEVAYINASPHPTEAFFLLWTRKEALLKACGTGIDDKLPAMPALDGSHPLPTGYNDVNWLTESFYTGEEFMGSVTYPSPGKRLEFWELGVGGLMPLI